MHCGTWSTSYTANTTFKVEQTVYTDVAILQHFNHFKAKHMYVCMWFFSPKKNVFVMVPEFYLDA